MDGASRDTVTSSADSIPSTSALGSKSAIIILSNSEGDKRLTKEERRERRRRAREATKPSALTWSTPRTITITSPQIERFPNVLEIPLQADYRGSRIISSEEASMRLSSPADLLEKLNEIHGTSYTFEQHPQLAQTLCMYIEKGYDFGIIYSYLRSGWDGSPTIGLQHLAARASEDSALRSKALDLDTGSIVNPSLPPRRVWDLYSNRVVPYYAVAYLHGAVSHSWMGGAHRHSIWTAINSEEWPAPIPVDTSLERIRIELLNLGLQCVWLDVLCLRQEISERSIRGTHCKDCTRRSEEIHTSADAYREEVRRKEEIRRKEWEVDVPTIGDVYHGTRFVVHYYSGLGRPFRIENLDSDRHWLNRAWTLQENTVDPIIAGISPGPGAPRLPRDSADGQGYSPDEEQFYSTRHDRKSLPT